MDSDEQLSPIGESSVPIPNRMLRRLKKATSISDLCPGSKTLVSEEDLGKHGLQSAKGFDGFEEEDGTRSDLEGLGVEDGVTARKVLNFDFVPEFNPPIGDLGEKGDEEISDSETREEIKVSKPDLDTSVPEFDSALEELGEKGEDEIHDSEAGKKRPVLETSDGEGKEWKRKKKRNKKNVDFDDLPVSSMNMTKKVTLSLYFFSCFILMGTLQCWIVCFILVLLFFVWL